MTAAEELVKLYEQAQQKLVDIITRKASGGSPAIYERRILKQVTAELKKLKQATPELVRQLVLSGYKTGLESAVEDILKAGVKTPPAYSMFSRVNTAQINLLVQNTVNDLAKAVNVVGRRMEDEIRQAGVRAAAMKAATGGTVRDMQKDLKTRLLGLDLKQPDGRIGVRYKNGKVVSIDTYTKMVARTTPAEAQNKAKIVQAQDWGYDLVRCTSHSPTCEVCAQYQDRVYALTREAANGKYKGPNGEPLRFPYLYDTALVHGYETIHPNCRHRFSILPAGAYTKAELAAMSRKSMQPFRDTRSDAERKAYAAEQTYNRRRNADLHEWRKYRAALPDEAPTTFSGFRSMKRHKSERYQELQRSYKASLAKSPGYVMLEINTKPIKITDESIARVAKIKSESISSEKLRDSEIALLKYLQGDSPEMEAIMYLDLHGNELARYKGGPLSVRTSKQTGPYVTIHNHPSGNTFSLDDVSIFAMDGDMQGMAVVGNNGDTYLLEKTEESDFTGLYHATQKAIQENPDFRATPEKYVAFMDSILKEMEQYGYKYRKG